MQNKLILIGYTGVMRAYLNVPREEAIARYTAHDGEAPDPEMVREFDFTDTFGVYSAWADPEE